MSVVYGVFSSHSGLSFLKMNILGLLAIMKSKKFEDYNSDRCVYIQGSSTLELEKQCSSSFGYLPKYTDIVQTQQNGKNALKTSIIFVKFDVFFTVRKLFDYLALRLSTMPPVDFRQASNNKLIDHSDEKFVEYK